MKASELPAIDTRSGWPWSEEPAQTPTVSWSDPPPRVTVVTPSFNQRPYLEATLRSVLLQDYPNLEYIVMDGGSTDGSVDVIRAYSKYLSYWASERDAGQADAINKGLSRATGEIYAWINSDDYFFPGAISHLVNALMSSEADLAHGDVWQAKEQGAPYPWRNGGQMDLIQSLRTNFVPVPQQGALWTRSLWESTGGLDVRWTCVLDRDFFVRAALHHRFHYVSGPVAVSRTHPAAKSSALAARWIKEMPAMYDALFRRTDLPPEVRGLRRDCLYAVRQACAQVARQNQVSAIPCLIAAAIIDPSHFLADEFRHIYRQFIKA